MGAFPLGAARVVAALALGTALLAIELHVGSTSTSFIGVAHADPVDKIGRRIINLEGEASQLSQSIRRPKVTAGDNNKANRRLIEAQVAFGTGNYDDAAIMLYDFVAKFPTSRDYDKALYYLAESLFLKGDLLASRTYFIKLVKDVGSRSEFYHQGLERLIELSLKLRDDANVQEWLDALDNLPPSQQQASVPYVRGKHAYFSQRYDEALTFFAKVPNGSKYAFQARYFAAGTLVAKGDLVAAISAYTKLMRTKPKNDNDKKILELSHLAIGRVYYACDEPVQCAVTLSGEEKANIRNDYERAKLTDEQFEEKFAETRQKKLWSLAIDHYLMISRRSDLFDEALFEIAWVYVKNQRPEKALRALELLGLANKETAALPEVRILEGNLRIRRAQKLDYSTNGNSSEEYTKAYDVFDKTRKTYKGAHAELQKIIAEHRAPRAYMAQITGRTSDTFDVNSTMPEVAASWLRNQPDVKRIVSIETDLDQIKTDVDNAERTIARLEQAMSSAQSVNIFPSLAEKRSRAVEILEEVFDMRIQLMNHERARVLKTASASEKAELQRLSAVRQNAFKQLKALPNSDVKYGERVTRARNEHDELDQRANEVALAIETTEATLVAIVKYIEDRKSQGAQPEELDKLEAPLAEVRAEVVAMKKELAAIRRDATLARDRAGVGDQAAKAGRTLRAKLRQAIEVEHRYMMKIGSRTTGGTRAKLDQIASLTQKANSITLTLDQTNERIREIVDQVLAEVRQEVAAEKAKLAAYKREFTEYSDESRGLGGEVLAENFGAVRDAFYDVVVRSDIGVIDITWAQREFADKTLDRLELDKKRDMRTLRVGFDQVLREEAEAKAAAHRERAKDDSSGTPDGGDSSKDPAPTDGAPAGGNEE